jgi:flavin prenyltransferase
MTPQNPWIRTVALAFTGASGMAYGLRLLECLLAARVRVYLLYSGVSQIVARQELDLALPGRAEEAEAFFTQRLQPAPGQLQVFGRQDWFSPAASGSGGPDAMVVCPCSMGSLAAIAHGLSDNLIERAADVMLKERRLLILVPRETPFSMIHLENMLSLSRAGAVILPANPGFYHRPASVEAVIDFVVARILDQLQVPQDLVARWGEAPEARPDDLAV